jgi:isocitrate dehydrogenase
MIDPTPSAASSGPGTAITSGPDGQLRVPEEPIVPFLEGDGVGPDIWAAARPVLEAAVARAYGGQRRIHWLEVFWGEKARSLSGDPLPQATISAIGRHHVALRGPLTVSTEFGPQTLKAALSMSLGLFATLRPLRCWKGVLTPMRGPEKLELTIFREITEDFRARIEWSAGSEGARRVTELAAELGFSVPPGSALALKVASASATHRLVRLAIRYALERGLPSLTLAHRGDALERTEGAFRDWGYETAALEFPEETISENEVREKHEGRCPAGRLLIKDRPADSLLRELLQRPGEFSVIAAPGLIGDEVWQAALGQVGTRALAPGAVLGETHAVFEVTHGAAPRQAGTDMANPSSLILSGALLLEHLGWEEAAGIVERALGRTIVQRTVTYDLERAVEGARRVMCSEFGQAVVAQIWSGV